MGIFDPHEGVTQAEEDAWQFGDTEPLADWEEELLAVGPETPGQVIWVQPRHNGLGIKVFGRLFTDPADVRLWESYIEPGDRQYVFLTRDRADIVESWDAGLSEVYLEGGEVIGRPQTYEEYMEEQEALAEQAAEAAAERYFEEGPHGGWYAGSEEEARDRYLDGLREQAEAAEENKRRHEESQHVQGMSEAFWERWARDPE